MRARGRLFMCLVATGAATVPQGASSQTQAWTIDPATVATFGNAYEIAAFNYGYTYVRLIPGGGIAAARRERYEVAIYDAAGQQERVLSAWPGNQLLNITGLAVGGSDTIYAYDVPTSGTLRRTRFLRAGQHLDTERVGVTDGPGAVYQGTLADGTPVGLWTKLSRIEPEIEVSDSNRIGIFDRDTVPKVSARLTGIRRQGSPIHFSPHPIVAVIGDTIFYSNGVDGLVQAVLPDGSTVRSFRVPVEPLSPDAAFARLAPELDAPGLNPDTHFFNRGEMVPSISDMLGGPEGKLWVKVYDPVADSHSLGRPRGGGEWLVLDTEGRIEARVRVPDGFRLMDIGPDRVAGILRDEAGERAATFALIGSRPAAE
jgi:hypothetical protein